MVKNLTVKRIEYSSIKKFESMNNKLVIIPFLLGLLLSSCTDKIPNNKVEEGVTEYASSKIVNSHLGSDTETLIVSLDMSRDAEGMFESLKNVKGIEDVEPVFLNLQDNKDATQLRKWHILKIAQDANMVGVANEVASLDFIKKIEFNTFIERPELASAVEFENHSTRSFTEEIFNDPQLAMQWHYQNKGNQAIYENAIAGADINVYDAWNLTAGEPDIIVAVIDGGIKVDHPDLEANMWVNQKELNGVPGVDDDGDGWIDDIYGVNFRRSDGRIVPDGHGTHVAGTVAAVNNNNIGVCGVAGGTGVGDGVRLMSCQIFDDTAKPAKGDETAKAFIYAADHGASIAQCSWGVAANRPGSPNDDEKYKELYPLEYDAIKYFRKAHKDTRGENGINGEGIVIFASGNEQHYGSGYPAAYRDFISVTAFAPDYLPATYTNYGPGVNIAAPGGEITVSNPRGGVLSTVPKGAIKNYKTGAVFESDYAYMQGTSMACPHVSGVAALGLSYLKKIGKSISLNEFTSILLTSVNDINYYIDKNVNLPSNPANEILAQYSGKMGTGSIDAWRFLMNLEGVPCLQAKVGVSQHLDLSTYFGGSSSDIKYILDEISIPSTGIRSLGLTEKPTIEYGKLKIHPTKIGGTKIKISAIAGGDHLGSDTSKGGMRITREISLISRNVRSKTEGWL